MTRLLEKSNVRFGSIRIIREDGGAVYYCLHDLCKMLRYRNSTNALYRYAMSFRRFAILNKEKYRTMYFINEYAAEDLVDRQDKSGVYDWLFGNGLSIEDEYQSGNFREIGIPKCVYAR